MHGAFARISLARKYIEYNMCRDTVLFTRELCIKKKKSHKESDLIRFSWEISIQRWLLYEKKKHTHHPVRSRSSAHYTQSAILPTYRRFSGIREKIIARVSRNREVKVLSNRAISE